MKYKKTIIDRDRRRKYDKNQKSAREQKYTFRERDEGKRKLSSTIRNKIKVIYK